MEIMIVFVIFFFVMLALAAVFIILNVMYESVVEKRMKDFASKPGRSYLIHMDNTLRPFLLHTPLATGGTYAKFVVNQKTSGKSITTAVWFNKEHTGRSSQTYCFQIAMMPVSLKTSGRILMRKEKMSDKAKNVFGVNDLDFEHQEFSDKYYIIANPEKFGYDFFHPRMIELFMQNPKFFALFQADHLIVYRSVPVKQGIIGLFSLIGGKCPQLDWLGESTEMVEKVEKMIAKHMRTRGK